MHFGCIPIILSDDLVYAYTHLTGGDINETMFSIRLPQSIVQFPTDYLLKKFGSPKAQKLFGHLPDGTYVSLSLEPFGMIFNLISFSRIELYYYSTIVVGTETETVTDTVTDADTDACMG